MHETYQLDQRSNEHAPKSLEIFRFSWLFRNDPACAHIEFSSLKRNFGRCNNCVFLDAAKLKALRSGYPEQIAIAKRNKSNHLAENESTGIPNAFQDPAQASDMLLAVHLAVHLRTMVERA